MKERLDEESYRGRVYAKTGFLDGVGALSGYALTRGGSWVAFSVVINNYQDPRGNHSLKEIEDKICRRIVDLKL